MSAVYLGRDTLENRQVAIKVMRPEAVDDPRLKRRFLNECRAVQRIDHPAVVGILDVGETDEGWLCLVMEYVDGPPLRKLLGRRPLRPSNAIPLIAAIAEGLEAAHLECVIHRDLKPENVLVPRESRDVLVKLVDFGLARIIDAPRITTTLHIMGTPHYIAPEQARGSEVDRRADIYALGIMMYEMLQGRLPFEGDEPDELLRQHISRPPPPFEPGEGGEPIPLALETLVARCLGKRPESRPSTMGEVLETLASIET
jgi:serine/threonine-protein kinase